MLHPLILGTTLARHVPPLMLADASATSLADFSGPASTLFNNMRAPASLLAGTLLGATWSLAPLATDSSAVALVKRLHTLVGLLAACSELIAIIVCTVAINKLSEIRSPQTDGVGGLLASSSYELSWTAANANFFFGLLGLVTMTGARGYLILASSGKCYAAAAACMAAAAGLLMTSTINTGIASGDGTMCGEQAPFGRSFGALFLRYTALLIGRARTAPLTLLSLLCAFAAAVLVAAGALAGAL